MIRTFTEMLDKRIKPNQQWTGLIYPILLTDNNKLVHSGPIVTPRDAGKSTTELMAYINMKLKAKHNRKYPELHIGNNLKIYQRHIFDNKACI